MDARALLEAIFTKGAAFFDTSGKGYLTVTGTLFVPMTGTVGEAARDFVDHWSRGKGNRQQLKADPFKTVEHMVAKHGLVCVFVTKRGVGLLSATERVTFNNYQREWLLSRFNIVPETPVFWSSQLNGRFEETSAEYAMFGGMTKPAREKFVQRRDAEKAQRAEFDQMDDEVSARSKGLSGLATTGPKRALWGVKNAPASPPRARASGAPNPKGTPISFLKGSSGFRKDAKIYGV